jgi:hypothetical protein
MCLKKMQSFITENYIAVFLQFVRLKKRMFRSLYVNLFDFFTLGRLSFLFSRGVQRDVVYLGRPIAPSFMSPNTGGGGWGGGGCGISDSKYTVQLCTWSPNKLGDLTP